MTVEERKTGYRCETWASYSTLESLIVRIKQFRCNLAPSKGCLGGDLFWTELERTEIPLNTEQFPETPHLDLENLPLTRVGPNIIPSMGFCWLFSVNTRASLIK